MRRLGGERAFFDNQSSRFMPGTCGGPPGGMTASHECLTTPAERIRSTRRLAAIGEPKTKNGDHMKGKIVRILAALGSLAAMIVAGSATTLKIG